MLLVIDNYDSFTYNLVQRLGEIDGTLDIHVARNDQITIEEIAKLDWVQSLFFKDRIIKRFLRIKVNFEFDDEEEESAYNHFKLHSFLA